MSDTIAATDFPPSPGFVEAGGMKYRMLGQTGARISILGVGGFHLGLPSAEEATRIIRGAIDGGIDFMDNCWDYHDGESEIRMGNALRDGYRQRVFLMTKIDAHDAPTAMQQIEECLTRLQTDRIDLLQFHEVIRMTDPERIFAAGGALEAAQMAREAGKIRFIGFTGHKNPAMHLRMLEVARQHGFQLDTVQMPINVMDAHYESFLHRVLPVAQRDGVAVLGMKSMGAGEVLRSGVVSPVECLRFAMSQPVATTITGIDSLPILEQALRVIRDFQPMPEDEQRALLARTAEAARDGAFEPFKTTGKYDGTEMNPHWLGVAQL